MTIKNNLYNIFGGSGRALLFLFTIPLMVNYMGVERFGIWALITSIGNIALILDIGIASTTMHFISELKTIESPKAKRIQTSKTLPVLLLVNLFFSLIIIILFGFFTHDITNIFLSKDLITKDIVLALKWIGLYSATILLQHFFSGIIQAYNQFLLVNIIKFVNIFTINVGLLIFSFLNRDFYYLTFFMFIVSLLTLIIYVYLSSKKINFLKIKFIYDLKIFKSIISYSVATWMGYLGSVIFNQFDKIIVVKATNPEVLGIYAAIISITSYISSISTVGLQPIIPKLTELWKRGEIVKDEFIEEYKHANQFNIALVFAISLMFFLVYKILLKDIMNIDIVIYPEANLAFQLAILIYALNSINVPGFYTLMAIKETKHIGLWQILGSATALLLIYNLGKSVGLYGVVIGNIGLIITIMFNCISSKKILYNSFSWLRYIYVPLILFLIVMFILLMIDNMYIKGSLIFITLIALFFWYFYENPRSKKLVSDLFKRYIYK